MKRCYPLLACAVIYLLCPSCGTNKNQDQATLIAQPWIVERTTFEANGRQVADSGFMKKVEDAFNGRTYNFKPNGDFTITSATGKIKGRWNFGKDDTTLLYHDLGSRQTMIVMRTSEDAEEVWMPMGGKSIFLDYADNTIQATVLPAIAGGNLYLTLTKK